MENIRRWLFPSENKDKYLKKKIQISLVMTLLLLYSILKEKFCVFWNYDFEKIWKRFSSWEFLKFTYSVLCLKKKISDLQFYCLKCKNFEKDFIFVCTEWFLLSYVRNTFYIIKKAESKTLFTLSHICLCVCKHGWTKNLFFFFSFFLSTNVALFCDLLFKDIVNT